MKPQSVIVQELIDELISYITKMSNRNITLQKNLFKLDGKEKIKAIHEIEFMTVHNKHLSELLLIKVKEIMTNIPRSRVIDNDIINLNSSFDD